MAFRDAVQRARRTFDLGKKYDYDFKLLDGKTIFTIFLVAHNLLKWAVDSQEASLKESRSRKSPRSLAQLLTNTSPRTRKIFGSLLNLGDTLFLLLLLLRLIFMRDERLLIAENPWICVSVFLLHDNSWFLTGFHCRLYQWRHVWKLQLHLFWSC